MSSEVLVLNIGFPGSGAAPSETVSPATGDWIGELGDAGHLIAGAESSLPPWVRVGAGLEGLSLGWGGSADDPRLLEIPGGGGRSDESWQSTEGLTVPLEFPDGLWHEVSLYFLDEDDLGREQTVRVLGSDGGILIEQFISNFSGGVYIPFRMRGQVTISVVPSGLDPAVLSGIFFDQIENEDPEILIVSPSSGEKAVVPHPIQIVTDVSDDDGIDSVSFFANGELLGVATDVPWNFKWDGATPGDYEIVARVEDSVGKKVLSAPVDLTVVTPFTLLEFLGTDASTQGNWIGVYGGEGHSIADQDVDLPEGLRFEVSGERSYTWANPRIGEVRAPLLSSGDSRSMAPWFGSGFSIDIGVEDGGTTDVSFYVLGLVSTDPGR